MVIFSKIPLAPNIGTKPIKQHLLIRVPLFINEGDHIRIDTRTGEYMERV